MERVTLQGSQVHNFGDLFELLVKTIKISTCWKVKKDIEV